MLQLSTFYYNLLEEFLKQINKKIKHLKKHKHIESIIIQQYLMDDLGILEISSSVISGMKEYHKAFNEFLKNSNFDENDPQYEELIQLKLELEEMEKKIESYNKKLFEFKM